MGRRLDPMAGTVGGGRGHTRGFFGGDNTPGGSPLGSPPALAAMLMPQSVAVIGATEKPGSVGRAVMENLGSFCGRVHPVNPRRPHVFGRPAFPGIAAVPGPVDLAVIATPAATVPAIVEECAAAGVRGAVILSAGFKESGARGAELERQIAARRGEMRIIGPNCFGIMVPRAGLNTTFVEEMAQPGSLALISQSGGLCSAMLGWSIRQNVGFSAFVSIGSMLDVGWGDLIRYLGDDPDTRSIVLYMESVGDARPFLEAAREVVRRKPIIVFKAGRTEAAARAAASHTGSLTGSDDVADAAFRQAGVVRVGGMSEMFDMMDVLTKQPLPRGPRLAIVTNGGAAAVMAADRLVLDGGKASLLSRDSFEQLDALLPPHWSKNNPVDVLGDADAGRYSKAVEIIRRDDNNDGLLVIYIPQAITAPAEAARTLQAVAQGYTKPILACWMGGDECDEGRRILSKAGIPAFSYPDDAARAFCNLWRYTKGQRAAPETPAPGHAAAPAPDRARAAKIIQVARDNGRTLLTEVESKQVLAAYGIPVVDTWIAQKEADAVRIAARLGGAVVLKVFSETITHKTDIGGVKLDLRGPAAIRRAYREIRKSVAEHEADGFLGVAVEPMIAPDGYELILGSSVDPQFGPVILFGTGGELVEVFQDHALALPPLDAALARRLMEQTRIYTALRGVRGRAPVDVEALEALLVSFSELVTGQPLIKEIDINPLFASSTRLLALDARIVLQHTPETHSHE